MDEAGVAIDEASRVAEGDLRGACLAEDVAPDVVADGVQHRARLGVDDGAHAAGLIAEDAEDLGAADRLPRGRELGDGPVRVGVARQVVEAGGVHPGLKSWAATAR